METIAISTKQAYKSDIEDSLKQKTLYKIFEYCDDYSYSNSDKIGICIRKYKDKYEIIFFQPDGPKTPSQIAPLIRWRISGESDEIGHKGGGNKRNLYGYNADKFTILAKINNNKIIKAGAYPKKILDFTKTDIDEVAFRGCIDTSEFITWPKEEDLDEMPTWYNNLYKELLSEANFEPNYIIKIELDNLPQEYIKKEYWNEFISQMRAKQYDVPIYFKNELLNMDEYKIYENIDLIGVKFKTKEKNILIYLKNDEVYIKYENKYLNVNNPVNDQLSNDSELKSWGIVNMYITNDKYFNDQLKEYNKNLLNKSKADDFYGAYLNINSKYTNYLPIEGNILPQSKNNKIDQGKSNNKFRMIFIPDIESCKNKEIFNKLIRTETIKALSGFLDKSPYKKIIKLCIDIYKGIDITKTKVKTSPKPKPPDEECKLGGGYLDKFAHNLWKRGIVEEYSSTNRRLKENKQSSIKMVKLFTGKDITFPTATMYYDSGPIKNFMTWEEAVGNILNKYNGKEITIYSAERGNKDREYFMCDNDDFITQVIIPEINQLNID